MLEVDKVDDEEYKVEKRHNEEGEKHNLEQDKK